MKYIKLLISILFFTSMSISSKGQNEINLDHLVGKWELISITNYVDNKFVDEITQNEKCLSYMHFHKNDKYVEHKYNDNCKLIEKANGVYKIDGQHIKTYVKGTENKLRLIHLKDDSLILENHFISDQKFYKSRFTLKKKSKTILERL